MNTSVGASASASMQTDATAAAAAGTSAASERSTYDQLASLADHSVLQLALLGKHECIRDL